MRRYGEPVDCTRRYTRRPGAYAILARGDQVLLTHQMEPEPEFQLPGGGIDPGENPVSALHREVLEETGWSISGLRWLTTYRRFTYMPEYDMWAEKVCQIFVARPARRLGPPTEEGHTAVWFPLALAAPIVASPGDRAALEQFIGTGPSTRQTG